MKTVLRTIMLAMLIISAMANISEAGWLIYHESELKGQILDIDTKLPIEGAVVVVVYKTATPGLGAGQGSSIIDVSETLTDKEGRFLIPSYTTIIHPFSWQIPNTVIIFKPGYARLELRPSFFTLEQKEDQVSSTPWSKVPKYRLRKSGIVELPMLKSKEERKQASPGPVGEQGDWKKQKKFIEAIRNDWKYLTNKDPKDLYESTGD